MQKICGLEDLKDLSLLDDEGKNRVIGLLENISKMVFFGSSVDGMIEDNKEYRYKTSRYARELLKKGLGVIEGEKYSCYKNLFRLTNIECGDDEPFSDCGVDKDELGDEIRDIEKRVN